MSLQEKPPSAALLVEGKALLDTALAEGQVDVPYVAALADVFDRYFRERLTEYEASAAGRAAFALVAVGGYGRRELCPASDIDVLVVFGGECPADAPELARFLFFPLWDLGVDLGHGVRTMAQCLELARTDQQVLASLLDARFIAGDAGVHEGLAARLAADVFPDRAADFALWLDADNKERKASYGDAGAMLEPNLKNGLGGLRAVHQVRWLLALDAGRERDAGLLAPELAALAEDFHFVLTARMHLHRLCGRKNDKLYFEFQERVAEAMGFGPRGDRAGVERFLAKLLRRMADIKALRLSAWPLLAGALGALDLGAPAKTLGNGVELAPEGLRFAPGLSDEAAMEGLFDLLLACARTGRAPSHETLRRMGGMAEAYARLAGVSPLSGRRLYEGLGAVMQVDATGTAMDAVMGTGLLRAALPEFTRVEDIVAFDIYHVHPVGRHTLEAVRLLAGIRAGKSSRYKALLAGLPRPELVFWGLLLHDVGKGLGGGHAEKGAQLAEAMLVRLAAPPEVRHAVAGLVREHLLLPETATGRDLADRDVVAGVAARVATVETLDMLTLIARCDGQATGPQAWTGWKESLIFELYDKVRAAIEQGRLFDAGDVKIMLATRERVRELAGGGMEPEALERALLAMPPRYLVVESPETILSHLALLKELDAAEVEDRRMRPSARSARRGRDVAVLRHEALPEADGFRLTVAARGVRALFATVCGALALYDLSIRDADVFAWEGGVTILSLRTANPPDVLYADEVFARVARAVHYALSGKLFLAYRLAKKRESFLYPPVANRPRTPPEVVLDDRASDLYTVVEVTCDDRVGLLYDIARTLYELRLETHLAKVVTPAGRVRDVFYVRGPDGRRVEDPEQAAEIKAALLHRLADDLGGLS
ncbi:HD domain-containing protein [Solidesulfovibrio sp. C21]|uniref:[protein-PII] uridylyltransferase family protein n=1 Tax=Solidesulfovibrio sp. C21 TaxID=3398613 RepID=UPI0039FBAAD9